MLEIMLTCTLKAQPQTVSAEKTLRKLNLTEFLILTKGKTCKERLVKIRVKHSKLEITYEVKIIAAYLKAFQSKEE